jgi:hypothetical protein
VEYAYGIITNLKFKAIKKLIGFRFMLMIEWYGRDLCLKGVITRSNSLLLMLKYKTSLILGRLEKKVEVIRI